MSEQAVAGESDKAPADDLASAEDGAAAAATEATVDDTTAAADEGAAASDSSVEAETDGDAEAGVEGVVASDGAYTVIVADFTDEDAAKEAYEELKDADDGKTVKIEGVLVVKRSEDGEIKVQKMTDESTKRGVAWGAVGGLVFGVLFPPSVIGSVLVGGLGGAAVGELRKHHHKAEAAEELDDILKPGHSGLIALVSDPAAVRVAKALAKAEATVSKAVDKSVADEIKAAAKDAESAG